MLGIVTVRSPGPEKQLPPQFCLIPLYGALSVVLIYSLHYTAGLQPGRMQCVM